MAELYEVETRVLNQSVKRNIGRFPEDFIFQLTREEFNGLISQFVTSKPEKRGGTQKLPYAFTEQGVAMLSGVLRSQVAVAVNIAIMRAFVHLRQFALNYNTLADELKQLEANTNKKFTDVFQALDYLIKEKKQNDMQQQRKRIGFKK